jgi:hypothetical protein
LLNRVATRVGNPVGLTPTAIAGWAIHPLAVFTICCTELLSLLDTQMEPSWPTVRAEGLLPTLITGPCAAKVVVAACPLPAALVPVTVNVYDGTELESPVNGMLVAVVVEVVVLVPLFIVTE